MLALKFKYIIPILVGTFKKLLSTDRFIFTQSYIYPLTFDISTTSIPIISTQTATLEFKT